MSTVGKFVCYRSIYHRRRGRTGTDAKCFPLRNWRNLPEFQGRGKIIWNSSNKTFRNKKIFNDHAIDDGAFRRTAHELDVQTHVKHSRDTSYHWSTSSPCASVIIFVVSIVPSNLRFLRTRSSHSSQSLCPVYANLPMQFTITSTRMRLHLASLSPRPENGRLPLFLNVPHIEDLFNEPPMTFLYLHSP